MLTYRARGAGIGVKEFDTSRRGSQLVLWRRVGLGRSYPRRALFVNSTLGSAAVSAGASERAFLLRRNQERRFAFLRH